jgi:hypothetical protein
MQQLAVKRLVTPVFTPPVDPAYGATETKREIWKELYYCRTGTTGIGPSNKNYKASNT